MKYKTQDTKFYIENNRLVGQSGPVPDDEPLFILRARDIHAIVAMEAYRTHIFDNTEVEASHLKAVERRILAFRKFAQDNPDRMKVPDTNLNEVHDGIPQPSA